MYTDRVVPEHKAPFDIMTILAKLWQQNMHVDSYKRNNIYSIITVILCNIMNTILRDIQWLSKEGGKGNSREMVLTSRPYMLEPNTMNSHSFLGLSLLGMNFPVTLFWLKI